MKRISKVLIAYDGSKDSESILADLPHAGLGKGLQVRVITVSDPWIPPVEVMSVAADVVFASAFATYENYNRDARAEAETLAEKAAGQLRKKFPDWKISSVTGMDSPAQGILNAAEKWKAGLIILGSKGHTALDRILMGSVSRKVLMHANCNVRIARPVSPHAASSAPRILLAVDGSRYSNAMVQSVALRSWPRNAEFRVMVVLDYTLSLLQENQSLSPLKGSVRGMSFKGSLAERIAEKAECLLAERGLKVTSLVREGDPRREIEREAKRFKATCLFLGNRGIHAVERFFLGSTSAALAELAPCTVEIAGR